MTVHFPAAACAKVAAEVSARIGTPSWVDPHNGGAYRAAGGNGGAVRGERTTGDGKYTDKFALAFADGDGDGDGAGPSCKVSACSESQVTSVLDFSTNYCNLRNLYCGEGDGCARVKHDLGEYEKEKCIVPAATLSRTSLT